MKPECSKFQPDIADYVLGRYEYIKNYDAFFKHLEKCADCRAQLFGMKDLVFEFQKAAVPPEEIARRMQAIKDIFKKTPPKQTGPVANLRATLKHGITLYKQGKYIEAKNLISGLAMVLSVNKKLQEAETEVLADAYYHLGLVYEKLNNTAEALANFSRAIELSPYDADGYYHRSVIYSQMNQHSSALNDLSSAILNNPDYTEAYFDRANINFMTGKLQEVLADCEKGLEIEPVSPYFYILRAMTYELLGKYKEAIIDCNAALKEFTDEPKEIIMLYTVRGRSLGVSGEFDRAISDFNKLIQLTPQDANVYFYRGVILANQGELKKATTDFKKALELKPGEPNITDSLLQAERELMANEMKDKLEKKEQEIAVKYGTPTRPEPTGREGEQEKKFEAEINQLKGEIKTIRELLIEIIRPKPEYSIPLPKPETGIFRMPVRPIVMPVPERPEK